MSTCVYTGSTKGVCVWDRIYSHVYVYQREYTNLGDVYQRVYTNQCMYIQGVPRVCVCGCSNVYVFIFMYIDVYIKIYVMHQRVHINLCVYTQGVPRVCVCGCGSASQRNTSPPVTAYLVCANARKRVVWRRDGRRSKCSCSSVSARAHTIQHFAC